MIKQKTLQESEQELEYLLGMIRYKYGNIIDLDYTAIWNSNKEKEYLKFLKAETIKRTEKIKYVFKNNVFYASNIFVNKNRECQCCNCNIYKVNDEKYYNKFTTCFRCYLRYIENNEQRWKEGWRPNNGRQ